jgi:hypothetical protein
MTLTETSDLEASPPRAREDHWTVLNEEALAVLNCLALVSGNPIDRNVDSSFEAENPRSGGPKSIIVQSRASYAGRDHINVARRRRADIFSRTTSPISSVA